MSDEWKSSSQIADSINKLFSSLKIAMDLVVAQEMEKVNRMKKTVEALEKQKKDREQWAEDNGRR